MRNPEKDRKAPSRQTFAEWAATVPVPETTVLAVPARWTFEPKECDTEYLIDFLDGLFDSMNIGNPRMVKREKAMARRELRRRGVTVTE